MVLFEWGFVTIALYCVVLVASIDILLRYDWTRARSWQTLLIHFVLTVPLAYLVFSVTYVMFELLSYFLVLYAVSSGLGTSSELEMPLVLGTYAASLYVTFMWTPTFIHQLRALCHARR